LETVHPVPAPFSTKALATNRIKEGGNNQNEILFNRGKAINFIINSLFKKNFLNISIEFRLCHQLSILIGADVGHSCPDYC
jgi:hypothetical protein